MDPYTEHTLRPADNSTKPPPKPPRPVPQLALAPVLCSFFVPGEPKAKGSWQSMILNRKDICNQICKALTYTGSSYGQRFKVIIDKLKYLRAVLIVGGTAAARRAKAQWAKAVEDEVAFAWAEQAGPMLPKEAAINIDLLFHLPRGVTVKRKYPTVSPDGDKLERLVMDCMEGIVYKNDAQVCDVTRRKRYAVDTRHGVEVSISLLQ